MPMQARSAGGGTGGRLHGRLAIHSQQDEGRSVTHFSRGHLAQIAKRVRKGNVSEFTAKSKRCLICGGSFLALSCPHDVAENQLALKLIRENLKTEG